MELAVICINDKKRPIDFPESLWIVEEVELYHVVKVQRMINQPGVFGFVLKERDLSAVEKYDSFNSTRFRPATQEDFRLMEELEELMQGVNELEFLEL